MLFDAHTAKYAVRYARGGNEFAWFNSQSDAFDFVATEGETDPTPLEIVDLNGVVIER